MKKVGLALGSGSAHGVAHIGIIQVFCEQGIPIDYVCGSSAGAVVGGLYCTGSDMYLAGKLCSSIDMSSFIDITVPKLGFIKGEKAENLVDMLTKGKYMEECDPPFAAVSCDMISGKSITVRSGRVSKACHASFAIPGIFEPVEWDGMQLIDGGTMNRVPIRQVREMGAEYVIGVDVGYQGWGHPRAGNLMEVFMNAFEMNDWQLVEKMYEETDVMIHPDLRAIPANNLNGAAECIALGRAAAEAVVDKIKEDLQL